MNVVMVLNTPVVTLVDLTQEFLQDQRIKFRDVLLQVESLQDGERQG